jgi:hypothetical protein
MLNREKFLTSLGGEIEAVTIAMNMAQAEYLHQIHDAVLKHKL